MIRAVFHWYIRTFRQMAVFTAGYIVGGVVVGMMVQVPQLMRAALALVP